MNEGNGFGRRSSVIETNPIPRRRLTSVKSACIYGCFARTKCYRLISAGHIRAYKFGSRTLIDLNSIDELHEALPLIRNIRGRLRASEDVKN
jgi:excisionase family DNA binding protein